MVMFFMSCIPSVNFGVASSCRATGERAGVGSPQRPQRSVPASEAPAWRQTRRPSGGQGRALRASSSTRELIHGIRSKTSPAFREPTRKTSASNPALAAAIRLHVAKALAPFGRHPEIELLDVLVLRQRFRRAVHHDATAFQDVAVVGV